MSEFVHLEDAKEFLRVTHNLQDSLIQRHLNTAESSLLRYLLGDSAQTLTMADYYYEYGDGPGQNRDAVELAVQMMVSSLYETPDKSPLTDAVVAVLRPLRDPQVG